MSYQGWTNEQTWCVAGYLNNTKRDQDIILGYVNHHEKVVAKAKIITYCDQNIYALTEFARWAWEIEKDGAELANVNFDEIYETFFAKVG